MISPTLCSLFLVPKDATFPEEINVDGPARIFWKTPVLPFFRPDSRQDPSRTRPSSPYVWRGIFFGPLLFLVGEDPFPVFFLHFLDEGC